MLLVATYPLCAFVSELPTRNCLPCVFCALSATYKPPILTCGPSVPTARTIWGTAWSWEVYPRRNSTRTLQWQNPLLLSYQTYSRFSLSSDIFFSALDPPPWTTCRIFLELIVLVCSSLITSFLFIIRSQNFSIHEHLSGPNLLLQQILCFFP